MLTLCHNYFRVTSNNKNPKDEVQNFSKRKFAFGLFILFLVSVLWVVSSELTKYIYIEKKLERPFLVTYVRSSLLFVYLLVLCFTPPTRDPCQPADYTQLMEPTAETDDENFYTEANNSLETTSQGGYPTQVGAQTALNLELLNGDGLTHRLHFMPENQKFAAGTKKPLFTRSKSQASSSLKLYNTILKGDSTFIPVRAGETTDSDDATPRAVRFNKVAEVRVMSAAMAGEALLARLSWSASLRATEYAQRRAAAAATRRHLKLALVFCLPWFVSNYLYRLSLLHTTACSATLYTSTTGAFALSIGAIFAQVPHDRFSLSKFVAILLTTAGLVVLGVTESHQNNWTAILAALGSALCYAVHLILFRQELRKGDGINSCLLVGVVGCACGCLAWAFGGLLALGGIEKAELPSPRLWSWLLLDGAIGPLLIESLWLWGRWLTSSQTATATLALTLPLCACAEAWRGGGGAWRTAAAALAAAGWLAAALPAAMPSPIAWLTAKLRAADGFTAIRNISELDEQSEALMSSDEPT